MCWLHDYKNANKYIKCESAKFANKEARTFLHGMHDRAYDVRLRNCNTALQILKENIATTYGHHGELKVHSSIQLYDSGALSITPSRIHPGSVCYFAASQTELCYECS